MSKLKFILIVVIFRISCCCCNFSEIVNIDEIIENSTLLPTFDDQIGSGKNMHLYKQRILFTKSYNSYLFSAEYQFRVK